MPVKQAVANWGWGEKTCSCLKQRETSAEGCAWQSSARNPPSNAGHVGGLAPGLGTKIPHATGQLSPHVTTRKPVLQQRLHTLQRRVHTQQWRPSAAKMMIIFKKCWNQGTSSMPGARWSGVGGEGSLSRRLGPIPQAFPVFPWFSSAWTNFRTSIAPLKWLQDHVWGN